MTHRGPFQPLPFCDSVNFVQIQKRVEVFLTRQDGEGSATRQQQFLQHHVNSQTTGCVTRRWS